MVFLDAQHHLVAGRPYAPHRYSLCTAVINGRALPWRSHRLLFSAEVPNGPFRTCPMTTEAVAAPLRNGQFKSAARRGRSSQYVTKYTSPLTLRSLAQPQILRKGACDERSLNGSR
jgi:hypothetical protein